MNNDESSMKKANGRIQKLKLLSRGSAMSGAPIIIGINQLASPTNAMPGKIIPATSSNRSLFTKPVR